jgi:hypothetical protein
MIVRDERPREVVDLSRAIRLREVNECNGDFTSTIIYDSANSTAFIDLPVSST